MSQSTACVGRAQPNAVAHPTLYQLRLAGRVVADRVATVGEAVTTSFDDDITTMTLAVAQPSELVGSPKCSCWPV
ncbi:hypothetical protein SAMN05216199_0275 [Pedococcus cremeus]|uniref:Uncharacterized protein n=1 Tax=Pedococcus cremeus TaxID=587636 RepID=A0A1H9XS90_9MICO|nr:hypothetical protein [Pedococcus cremeus]SES49022.1 hypothetical protein SAMN05216199_0275 [Pedococcus cremeus]